MSAPGMDRAARLADCPACGRFSGRPCVRLPQEPEGKAFPWWVRASSHPERACVAAALLKVSA